MAVIAATQYSALLLNGQPAPTLAEQLVDGVWTTTLQASPEGSTGIYAPCGGILTVDSDGTITIDSTQFMALRAATTSDLLAPLLQKVVITACDPIDSTYPFNPAGYLSAVNDEMSPEETPLTADSLWSQICAPAAGSSSDTGPADDPSDSQISIYPNECLGALNSGQSQVTVTCYLDEETTVPLSWVYAKLVAASSAFIDAKVKGSPLASPLGTYVDFLLTAVDNPASALPQPVTIGSLTVAVAGTSLPAAPLADSTCRRLVLALDSNSPAGTSLVVSVDGDDGSGNTSNIPISAATPGVSAQAPTNTVTVAYSNPYTPTYSAGTVQLVTGPAGASLTVTSPTLLGNSILVFEPSPDTTSLIFAGYASSPSTVTGQFTGGDPTPSTSPAPGKWQVEVPVPDDLPSTNLTVVFQSTDGAPPVTVSLVPLALVLGALTDVNNTADAIAIYPDADDNRDSLEIQATLTGTDALVAALSALPAGDPPDYVTTGNSFDPSTLVVQWTFLLSGSTPARADLRMTQDPTTHLKVHWIDFQMTAVTSGATLGDTWDPPGLTVVPESVHCDNPNDTNAREVDLQTLNQDFQGNPWTGNEDNEAGPATGLATVQAMITGGGIQPVIVLSPQFPVIGYDLTKNVDFSVFQGVLNAAIADTFPTAAGKENPQLSGQGFTADSAASFLLALYYSEATCQQFINLSISKTYKPDPPQAALSTPTAPQGLIDAKAFGGVLVGSPAGVGIGQVDPTDGNLGPSIALCFDWRLNVQRSVEVLLTKFNEKAISVKQTLAKAKLGLSGENLTKKQTEKMLAAQKDPDVQAANKAFVGAVIADDQGPVRWYARQYRGDHDAFVPLFKWTNAGVFSPIPAQASPDDVYDYKKLTKKEPYDDKIWAFYSAISAATALNSWTDLISTCVAAPPVPYQ